MEGVDFPIGRLDYADAGRQSICFAYADDWLAHANAFPISLSLPLKEGPHNDRLSRAYFNNLLQENDQLDRLLQREGIERSNLIGILRILGADCAGALSCLPKGAPPVKRPGNLNSDYDVIDQEKLEDLIKRLAAGQSLPEQLRDPSPVAGYRRKISLAMTMDGQFAVPKRSLGVPTTHILKIPDPGHRNEAQQEAAAAKLALACGFRAARSVVVPFEGQDIILIQRFDRLVDQTGQVARLHQEDFAQALGLPSEYKYERRGEAHSRFDAAGVAQILSQTEAPALARVEFLKITLFNLLIGNTDNHAKNHALLYASGSRPVLAPLYDMVPIPLGGGYTDEFAFQIGTAKRMRELKLDDLLSFYATIGIPPGRAKRVLDSHLIALVGQLEIASQQLTGNLKRFDMLIGREMKRMLDLAGLDVPLKERDYLPDDGERGGWANS